MTRYSLSPAQHASGAPSPTARARFNANRLAPEDAPVHRWYRFVLSFPPHLVRTYLDKFGVRQGQTVLDPFCGTGTTIVECKKLDIESIGIERNSIAFFATQVKTDWTIDADQLVEHALFIAERVYAHLTREGFSTELNLLSDGKAEDLSQRLRKLPENVNKLLLRNSISPIPLHKTLVLLGEIEAQEPNRFSDHERLAVAKILVHGVGNLHFGPEVGVGPPKSDAPVVSLWMDQVRAMADDLQAVQSSPAASADVHFADAREVARIMPENRVDAVITSPPYPNEKDYTRTTRLESVLLGFLKSRDDLRALKRHLVRSNTRGVYKLDEDDAWVEDNPVVQEIADAIERRRVELGKTSGFERMYPRVTKLYFGGMARHLADLRAVLRPGANLAYVVGDQASYLRVMIRTGEILGQIAESLGYQMVGRDLFRTRLATATKEQLREEVLLLRWKG